MSTLTRRRFLQQTAAMAAVAAPACRGLANATSTAAPLRQLGSRRHLKVGVAAQKSMLADSQMAAFIAAEFNLFTPGREFGWGTVHPADDRYDFSGADWMVQFAQAHQLEVHGHCLCWNDWNPKWLDAALTSANAEGMLASHIETVMSRYRGRIPSWDVVNEPIRTGQGKQDGLSDGPWLRTLGPRYIELAFQVAAETDPHALRVLNLDTVEQDDGESERNRAASLALIECLLKERVPLQAIGLESHLTGKDPAKSKAGLAFMRQIKSMGLQLLVTELDVNDTAIAGEGDDRKKLDGQYYDDYIQEVLSVEPTMLIFWTPTDKNNYWDSLAPRMSMYRRADGGEHYPGLLNKELLPNPALSGVRAALAAGGRS